MEKTDLFRSIEAYGDPEKNRQDKVGIIGKAEDILGYLGVNSKLVVEVAALRRQTEPLSTLILARKPEAVERVGLEGRGAYHDNIPVGDRKAVVYVKGIGNERTFDEEVEHPFPGFPSEQGKLFFDETFINPHPRMVGTETLTWALLELINSSVIFTQLAKKYGWQSLEEAIDAGVTTPLQVTHYKELSEYLQNLIRKEIDKTEDMLVRDSLEWRGNFIGIGSVAEVVPSKKRVEGGLREAETGDEKIARLTDPEIAATTGRTLRELFDVGFVYSESSAHGQNLYDRGLVAQADNSDLVYLGDFQGVKDYQWNSTLTLDIPPQIQQICLTFKQFERDSFLTPLHYPVPETNTSWDKIVALQKRFWGEMLKGLAHPDAVPILARLVPYLRSEIGLAAAVTLVESADQQRWKELADKKQQLIDQYDAFGVPEEYEKKKKNNLPEHILYPIMNIIQIDKVPARGLQSFIISGDVQDLLQDKRIRDIFTLMRTVEGIEDTVAKEKIIQRCGHYYGRRNIEDNFGKPDQIASFEGAHVRMITKLISEGRYEDVVKVIETLNLSNTFNFRGILDNPEAPEDRYPRMLLETNDIQDIYEHCRFDFSLSNFARSTQPFSLRKIVSEVVNKGEIQKESFSISDFAKDHTFPLPLLVIERLLGQYEYDISQRQGITEWILSYIEKAATLQQEHDNSTFNSQAVVDELDAMAATVKLEYPELAFGHAIFMTARYRTIDEQKAAKYYESAVDYYRNTFPQRQRELDVNVAAKDTMHTRIAKSSKLSQIAKLYHDLGFPYIAKKYDSRARQSFMEDLW